MINDLENRKLFQGPAKDKKDWKSITKNRLTHSCKGNRRDLQIITRTVNFL